MKLIKSEPNTLNCRECEYVEVQTGCVYVTRKMSVVSVFYMRNHAVQFRIFSHIECLTEKFAAVRT